MDRLVLVKHSLPVIVPTPPATTWQLGSEGRRRARRLAARLAADGIAPALLATSPEPKAAATATAASLAHADGWPPPMVDPGLREHERATAGWLGGDGFDAAVARLFAHPTGRVFGEGSAAGATARFAAAVDASLAAHPTGDIVLVTHGTVIALFVAHRTGLPPLPLWRRLGLPSCVVLRRPDLAMVEVVEAVEAVE